MPSTIDWTDFEKVDLRVGVILAAHPNPKARKPAFVLTIDLGSLGHKTSSAQITQHYEPHDLVGRQVLCVCNFPPRNIAGVVSEVLVTGIHDAHDKVVLAEFNLPLIPGSRLM